MSAVMDRADELAALITRHTGIAATADPAALNPPAVLVGPPLLTYDSLAGDGVYAEFHLWCCATGAGTRAAWVQMDDLRAAVSGVLPVESATPRVLPALTGLTGYPAYDLIYREEISP